MSLAAESDPCRCAHRRLSHTRDDRCLAMNGDRTNCGCTGFRLDVPAVAAQPDLPVEE